MAGADGNDPCNPPWFGCGRPARRNHAPDTGGMGTSGVPPRSFFGRFRAVPSAAFINAIIILYLVAALLGAVVYLYFRVHIQPELERDRHWSALGLFELKEHFVSIGLALLPAYWVCWRRPIVDERLGTRRSDPDPCLHRLVGLFHRSRHEQHHGLWAMMSRSGFAGSQLHTGRHSRLLYVIALKVDLALFTVYPSLGVVLLGTHHSKDVVDPAMGFLAPADVLVRVDGHRRARSTDVQPCCRVVA